MRDFRWCSTGKVAPPLKRSWAARLLPIVSQFRYWGRVHKIVIALALGWLPSSPGVAQQTDAASALQAQKQVILRNVRIPMRDGTELSADIYLPSGDGIKPSAGRFPILLMRTPYGKSSPLIHQAPDRTAASLSALRPEQATARGYIFAIQDVRGTSGSQGTFQPMRNEANDGVDTVAWLTRQPWSDGRIGTFGGSYMGGVQLLLASEKPPQLVTAFAQVAATDQFRNEWVYMDGVLAMTGAVWTPVMIDAYAARLPDAERAGLKADYAELGGSSFMTLPPAAFGKIINSLPLTDMPVVRRAPWWQDWLKNRDNPTFFKNNEMTDHFKNVDVPILHLGGWYDLFLRNTIGNFKGISTQAKSGFARRNQRLIIGQWSHGSCIGCPSNAAFNAEALQFAWMDRWFRNRQFTVFSHPVILYVMGENRWRAESSWPLPNTVRTRYYLHSRGTANSAAGDGALSTSPPDAEAPDHFEYDPAHPAPSLGGPGLSGSRADQKVAEARNDVLVYSTPPLVEDIEVTGEIGATLYAATSATDTDWWMKLIDVDAAGKPEILAQGVVRARYRSSRTNPAPTQPGKIEKYSINMWATSNVFKKGHRIRVEVTSSNFPYADRNPNAFVNLSTATEKDFVVASQSVFHSESGASFIELPIIPASRQRLWIDPPDQGLPK